MIWAPWSIAAGRRFWINQLWPGTKELLPAKRKRVRVPAQAAKAPVHATRHLTYAIHIAFCVLTLLLAGWGFREHYALSFQSPVRLHFQWPIVITERLSIEGATEAAPTSADVAYPHGSSTHARNSVSTAVSLWRFDAPRIQKASARFIITTKMERSTGGTSRSILFISSDRA